MSDRTNVTVSIRNSDLPDLVDALVDSSGYSVEQPPPPEKNGGNPITTKAQLARWSHAMHLKRLVAGWRQQNAQDSVDIS